MANGHFYKKIITTGADKDADHVGFYAKATGLFFKLFGATEKTVAYLESPTFTTPNLGTPSAVVLTNATGLPAASVNVGALADGMTSTTQAAGDNSTKLATTAYADIQKDKLLSKNYTPASNAADTNELLLHSHQIAASVVASGDLLEIWCNTIITSSVNDKTYRIYFNTSASLVGATLMATYLISSAGVASGIQRSFPILSDTTVEVHGGATIPIASNYYPTLSSGTTVAITVPSVSAGFYILISGQKEIAGETLTVRTSFVKLNRA